MQIPHFWGKESAPYMDRKGNCLNISCWGWSDVSPDEAIQKARERVQAVVEKLGQKWIASGEDYYVLGGHPLREEIIQEYASSPDSSKSPAVITRNINGCLVLNTDRAAFVDIDTPVSPPWTGLFGILRRLLRGKPAPTESQLQDAALAKLSGWISAHPGSGARVYRTRAGLRYLMTHEPLDPDDESLHRMMEDLGADPLYMRLCRTHHCYRARLTAKPWRIGLDRPASRYPHPPELKEDFKQWLGEYERTEKNFAACQFMLQMGCEAVHPEIAPWVEVHDEYSRAHSGLPLA